MSFTASLASLTSTFSSIVVFGTGVALINSKSGAQAAIISIAALSFLIQRTVFMTLLEVIPKLDCTIANTLTYSMLVIMRFSILGGLFMRARGANRVNQSKLLHLAIALAVFLGVGSTGLLFYQGFWSPFIPDTCRHRLDPTITIVNNVSFVLSLSILTAVVSIPISHALSSSQQAIDSISRVHQQARVLSKFILIVPATLCVLLLAISLASSYINNRFLFFASLAFSDFCQMLLLLFPVIIMSGDNYNSTGGERSQETAKSSPHQRIEPTHPTENGSLHTGLTYTALHYQPNDSTQYQKTQNSAHYQQQQPHSRQASALLPQIYFYPPTPPPTFSGPAQTQTHMNYWGQNRQSDYEISSSSDILSSSSKRTHLGNEGGF
ncbi:hypothetical protein BASA50_003350 [Batrachochytrium salamandrivorans]|uniref:G-protein coupled receptors family 3 profile domain-containing protein n=1 Tax=Batrachochytrium salamandrivorans TaxID=1357716 RepID=A0ABQ8FLB2_9FUNG|nr:hypothetical protein BASA61_010295 [Batrachochytrium salamandrivorans]KAH6598843.1 hypothetical protein BASA50_003350 [Batrachochytrium salamandrivorans]KAH9257112.1 hypothetical protein BASA81_004662 [Batrachochytrium salamandrivorans]